MSANPTFGTQLIGQTEKTMNAILDRLLAGPGLTEPQWVMLTLAVTSGGPVDRDQFVARVVGAAKYGEADVQEGISELAAAGLLDAPEGDGPTVAVTEAGKQLHARIRVGVAEITERLWGDLPPEDLTIAGRVLATVLERANEELARI
jgi:hypothetical protein